MKKFLGTITALISCAIVHAQSFNATITDKQNKPVDGALVVLSQNNSKYQAISDSLGNVTFKPNKSGLFRITVQAVGKKTLAQDVALPQSSKLLLSMEDLNYFLEPLEVKAVRASDNAPFTKTNITAKQIAENNLGQDLPFVLNHTPSVIVSSDAGNGIGYTGIRIRGSDATRINMTINGIPYNDAESQGSFFVNIPDIVSSADNIQIQRGVGTSTNGSGAFGATINLSTNEFNEKPYAEISNSYGSFNSWKNTAKFSSGLINDHFVIDARLSRISSDGYIERATSNLQSLYLSAAYLNHTTSIRFNLIKGKEKTYQAWYGVPQDSLKTHRRLNLAGTEKPGDPYNNETDNYNQDHYQLFYNQGLNNGWSMNIASFLTRGKGYYEEYKAGAAFQKYGLPDVIVGNDTILTTDLVRQKWLDNYYYGQVFSLQKKGLTDEWTFGGAWTNYDGKHYGKLIWGQIGIPVDYKYYNYPAVKTDVNVYAKWLHQLNEHFNLFADMQYRYVMHNMEGFENNPTLFIKRKFNFFNPKAGVSYRQNNWNAYLSYAMANKEPNRDDFEAGATQQPQQETLHDIEAGVGHKGKSFNWNATVYYMQYKDQLVLTGAMNDVGAYTRINVPNSYRLGLELQADLVLNQWLILRGDLALSSNKIKSFTQYFDQYDGDKYIKQIGISYSNTDISFSPSIIAGGSITIKPVKNLAVNLFSKYVGKQYLDNTQSNDRKISDYYVQDFRANYTIKDFLFSQWDIILQVNNIFNRMYEPNGATYPQADKSGNVVNSNYYMPMSGTNFMAGVTIRF